MFYPGILGKRKNWGKVRWTKPGRKSFVMALLALILPVLFSFNSGETETISAASPNDPYAVDHVIFGNTPFELYTEGQWAPYVRPQDSFMLVQGNESSPIIDSGHIRNLNSWARTLKAKYPNRPIYAATSGIENVRRIAQGVDRNLFTGIMYVYEPTHENNTPEFSWDAGPTEQNMRQVASIVGNANMEAWGKPTGMALKPRPASKRANVFDYGELGRILDGQNVQTQFNCKDLNEYKTSIDHLVSQFRDAGATSHLFAQVTVAENQVAHASPNEAIQCAKYAWSKPEIERVTLWPAAATQQRRNDVERFLQLRENLLDNLPPTPTPGPTPTPTPTPDPGVTHPLPGHLEAEDYQSGGEGVGYHDTTPGNAGGQHRSNDVDVEVSTDVDGGFNVGWIDPGEWLAFKVNVAQTADYDLTARVASAQAGDKTLHVELDGVDVTGPMTFTDSSGWQSWQDITVPEVSLTAGEHELRIVMDSDFFNLNYLSVIPAPGTSTRLPVPGRIEAEAYKSGGEGTGYHDATSGNTGGELRSEDVDIEATADAGGGFNVGWIDPGEWLAYDVAVSESRRYDLVARVASAVAGVKSLRVEVDGVDVSGLMSFTDASGWQSWVDVVVTGVSLAAGEHELRLVMDADSFNLNYLDVIPSSVVYGDANGDGAFTGDDIYLVVDWVIGRQAMPPAGDPSFVAADVNGDGSVDSADVALLIGRLSGALSKFPVEP